MPTFQNTTNYSINAVVNGSRRTIRPGQMITGPESLTAIPGLALVGAPKKTIIVDKEPSLVSSAPVSLNEIKMMDAIKNDPLASSNLSHEIDQELKYLEYMKSLGENPSLTVAILTKNRFDLISDCCESIFKQVKYKNLTILIADTGTTDQQVKTYYQTLPSKCEAKGWKFKLVLLGGYHFSKNYNVVVREHVDTEYVLIQNNDTVALNDYITEMMGTSILRRVGSTGCRMLYKDGTIQHDGQTIFGGPGKTVGGIGHVHLRNRVDSVPANEHFTHLVDGNTAAGVIMRRADFISINGLDENYKDIFQDVDLMMKIPSVLNKFNYCNRQALITHLDNASRLEKGHDPQRNAHMWEDTHYIKARINDNGWQRAKLPKEVDFSIITLVYNLDEYREFCESLRYQIGSYSVEVIGIPNFFNLFESAYKGLNTAADTANGKHIIFCHDDIVVPKDWLYRIRKNILELDAMNTRWGVLGPAGVFLDNDHSAYFLLDESMQPMWQKDPTILHDKTRYEISSLDELCLITKRSNSLRFSDKNLSGFHFYGVNLCLEAQIKGYKNFSIDAYCHHKSDGNKNVATLEKYQTYENDARSFHMWARSKGFKTWRSTTAKAVNDTITMFIKKPV